MFWMSAADAGWSRFVGYDFSREALSYATEQAKKSGLNNRNVHPDLKDEILRRIGAFW